MKYPNRTISQRFRRGVAVVGVMAILAPFMPVPTARAASNNYIISDADLFDGNAMSAERVQRFLQSQGGYLAGYRLTDNGQTKRAADVIADVGREYNLSQKFFLALLQKEQSLISDASPTQNQLDYALGYGCPSSCSAVYRGFGTQLRSAAKRIRESYLPGLQANGQFNGWGPGITKRTIDGIDVTPANNATAILYIYNPYVGKYGGGDQRWGANSLFQRIWNSWFGRVHPDGSLLRARGQAGIWLLRNGKRSAFLSRAAFAANYDSSKVIVVDPIELENYAVGPALRFPEPSLIQMRSGGMYLLVNNEKRPIASKEVLRNLGYNPEEIIRRVKPSDLEAYPKGAPVTEADVYPTGRLLQSRQTGAIVYVDNANVRHPIFSKEILRSRFKNQRAERVSDSLINALPTGDPVLFRDGEIVASRTTGKVYIISNGQRRRIPNVEAFRELGYKSKNIIKTNDRSIDIHPEGEPLNDISD